MALYQDSTNVQKTTHEAFDSVYGIGVEAPHAGIYRCIKCGHEIGIARGHKLPTQSHPQHPSSLGDIKWKLLVYAVHKND